MSGGVYTEKLPFGTGELKVTQTDWSIEFYFPGPDLRYNGTFFTIRSREVDDYVRAYQANWSEYCRLSKITPAGAQLEKLGTLGMTIRVGGFHPGVCLAHYHLPIASEQELNRIIQSLQWAKQRAHVAQAMLRQL